MKYLYKQMYIDFPVVVPCTTNFVHVRYDGTGPSTRMLLAVHLFKARAFAIFDFTPYTFRGVARNNLIVGKRRDFHIIIVNA